MIKYNRNFAKVNEDGTLSYAPMPMKVKRHYHQEGIHPKTGKRWVLDWDADETVLRPTATDYSTMGYSLVVVEDPRTPPKEGFIWRATGKWAKCEDGRIHRVFVEEALPPPPPPPPKRKCEKIRRFLGKIVRKLII